MKKTRTDYRQNAFRIKFMNASKHLGVAPDQIISLKLRDMVTSYSEYHNMLRILDHEAGIQSSPIQDDLQGKGHLVSQGDQRIIVVEHETGLEILFVASSIASLIGLVPLVLQAWSSIRGHFTRRHANHIRDVEIRRIDSAGNLQEEHPHNLTSSSIFPLSTLNSVILSVANVLEDDLKSLRQEVRSQNERLAAIEKALKPPNKVTTKKRTDKKSSNKKLKRDAAKSRRAS
jgi:hypothetical protein